MTGRARRLFVLQFGAELVPKSLSVAGDSDRLFWAPITGVLVDTGDRLILFDSGMRRGNHDSLDVDEVYGSGTGTSRRDLPRPLPPLAPEEGRWTWGRPGEPLAAALSDVGLTVDDLDLAVISHLHWDHTGGIGLLAAAGVPVLLHADEADFAVSDLPRFAEGFDRRDWEPAQARWETVSGDTEVADGVTVLATPGHTPGHLSLRVDLPGTGTWLFPADAADLAQNFIDGAPCGSCTGASSEQAERSLQKLLSLAADTSARILAGHDPVVAWTGAHPPGGHR